MAEMRVLNVVPSADSMAYSQQLKALERRGIACETISAPGTHVPGETTRSVMDYARLYPRVLRASFDQYDLIHANQGIVAPVALAQPNVPVILSLWGTDLYGRIGPLSRLCSRYVDELVVMSDRMANTINTDCHVIPHGVDLERFKPCPRQEAKSAVNWDADRKHILFPYSPERPVKDFSRARRIVAAVRKSLDTAVKLQPVFDVPHVAMSSYLNAADALLLTSKHEGSPNSVKEALACNLPVVSTDVGDVRERLDGVTPSFVCRTDEDLVDALGTVLERCVRSNGRNAISDLTLDRTARCLEAVYESALNENENHE